MVALSLYDDEVVKNHNIYRYDRMYSTSIVVVVVHVLLCIYR